MSELTIGILLTDHVLEDLQVKHGDQNDFYNKIFTLRSSLPLKIRLLSGLIATVL